MFVSKSRIVGFGAYLPEQRLTNAQLEQSVGTTDEWIVQRTGIRERRIAGEQQYASDLAVRAVDNLMELHGARVDDVDMILVTTFTPDHFSPTVSGMVQGHFGMRHTGTMDIGAGCTGFNYALLVADSLITCGRGKKVLVIAAETCSKVADYTDRTTCILFGDAAAACLLEHTDGPGAFRGAFFTTDGDQAANVACCNHADTVNGVRMPARGVFYQNGKQVYKYVVQNAPAGIQRLLESAGLTLADIDRFVPHSANMRMLEAICDKLGYPVDSTLTSLEYCGNTSSATIPLALWLAQNEGRVGRGDTLLLYGFGGGLTHGGLVATL